MGADIGLERDEGWGGVWVGRGGNMRYERWTGLGRGLEGGVRKRRHGKSVVKS